MAEFEPITIETQEQLDGLFRERLGRQERKHAEIVSAMSADAEALKSKITELEEAVAASSANAERVTALESTLSELQQAKAEADDKISKLTFEAVKRQISDEHGLSADAREFLTGTTEEELRKSAEKLKKLVGSRTLAPLGGREPTTEEAYFEKKYGKNKFYKK